MSSIDIRAEIDTFKRRKPGPRRDKIRTRLLYAGAELEQRAQQLAAKLALGYDRAPADEWIEKLHEYEAMCDAVAAIEREVLRD